MKICFFDLETTGVLIGHNDKKHRIIEIGAMTYDTDLKKFVSSYEVRINPLREIDKGAYETHHIALGDLVHCKTWSEIGPEFYNYIKEADYLVAHNGYEFDIPFLQYELERLKLTIPTTDAFDTMVESRWATVDGKLPKLGELCFAVDVEYDPAKAHGALYDVEVMAKAFLRAVELNIFEIKVNENGKSEIRNTIRNL